MATTITYIILPFLGAPGNGDPLRPGTPQRAKDRAKAIAAAERMAGQYAGIVVLEERADPEQDIYAEPELVRLIGRIPDEMASALAA